MFYAPTVVTIKGSFPVKPSQNDKRKSKIKIKNPEVQKDIDANVNIWRFRLEAENWQDLLLKLVRLNLGVHVEGNTIEGKKGRLK